MSQTFKHVIIVSHPEDNSFTLAVARRYAKVVRKHGHEAIIRDLYRLSFDPLLKAAEREGAPGRDVTQEWAVLGKPDVFVLVYPVWFGSPPAMLKGYIDRVFGAGRKRGQGGDGGTGELLAGKRLVSLTSSGSERTWLNRQGVLKSLHTVYDSYFAEVFGFTESHRHHFDGVTANLAQQDIDQRLLQAEKFTTGILNRMAGGPPDRDPNRP